MRINVDGVERDMTAEEAAIFAQRTALNLDGVRAKAVARIDAAFVAALAADNPSGYTFTHDGQTYVMPVTLDHQALATLALLEAKASNGTVSVPHLAGILDVTNNAAGVAILAGYAARFKPHTMTQYLRRLAIAGASTKEAIEAVVW